jgi:hypothetical protein
MPTKRKAGHKARAALLDFLDAINEVRRTGRSLPKVERVFDREMNVIQRTAHRLLGLLDTVGETEG